MNESDDRARREYWATKMEEADAFMRRIMAYPVVECGEPMVSMVESVQTEGIEVVFSELPHVGGLPRLYFLRQGLVPEFLAAASEMNALGWVLKVEDGFRTLAMQRGLGREKHIFMAVLRKVRWECGEAVPPTGLILRRLAALVANAPKVGTHMSGSAIDISVLSRDTGKPLDRGGPYLELSERTPMDSPYVSEKAQENRREITALMARHGFVTYPWEFWHYNAGDAYAGVLGRLKQPARYGAVHMHPEGTVTPVADPTVPLNSEEDIQTLVKGILPALP